MIPKVKAFLNAFRLSSIPHQNYYRRVTHESFRRSFLYWLTLVCVSSIIFIVLTILIYNPFLISSYRVQIKDSLARFPSYLSVSIRNGTLWTNQSKPVFIWLQKPGHRTLLAVIDKQLAPYTASPHNALITFGRDGLSIRIRSLRYDTPYDTSSQISLSSSELARLPGYLDSAINKSIVIFYILFLIIGPLLITSFSFFSILGTSMLVWAFFRLFQRRIHLKKIIQIGAHSTSLPLVLGTILFVAMPTLRGAFILGLAVQFVFHLVATYEAYADAHTPSRVHHTKKR